MKTVVVGSANPVKLAAVQAGFGAIFRQERFELRGVEVPSGVSDQPLTDGETLQGARQRAENAREQTPEADFGWALKVGWTQCLAIPRLC